jgi:hypothetical protein
MASVAGLTTLGAAAASAAPAQPAMTSAASRLASPDVITRGIIQNAASALQVQTTGHNNPVIVSGTGHSLISQVDCRVGVRFPNGTTHNVCLLENASGLCIDAPNTIYLTAESCQVGDPQEYWWAEPNPMFFNYYWIINFYWSSASQYAYMTQVSISPGSAIDVAAPGQGLYAEWHYS